MRLFECQTCFSTTISPVRKEGVLSPIMNEAMMSSTGEARFGERIGDEEVDVLCESNERTLFIIAGQKCQNWVIRVISC